MRYLAVFTILLLNALTFGQTGKVEPNPLLLKGTVKNVEIKKIDTSSKEFLLAIDLKMTVSNESSENVIFFSGYNQCSRIKVTKENGENMGYFSLLSSSFLPKLKQIDEKLNKNSPPEKFSKILLPNGIWEFDFGFEESIPAKIERSEKQEVNEKGETLLVVTESIHHSPISLEDIKNNSRLKFQPECRMMPVWIDNNNQLAQDLTYFGKLGDKWKNYGNLWTGILISDPILIDFQNVNEN